ncbi:hypothetical protein Csa_014233 [Cucumis sativus]|nr:hypothetical protein Csa_014233 [Cucumis sativus]
MKMKENNDDHDGLTHRQLFTKEHENLRKDEEQWIKNMASSCMLVATLVVTMVFAALYTLPGGNNDKDGIPIFEKDKKFAVFIIADFAALVMSTTSILTFLSILILRYAEEDFFGVVADQVIVRIGDIASCYNMHGGGFLCNLLSFV